MSSTFLLVTEPHLFANLLNRFQGIVILGAYRATTIPNSFNALSPFNAASDLGPPDLRFSLAETNELFNEVQRQRLIQIDPAVVHDVHSVSDGYSFF